LGTLEAFRSSEFEEVRDWVRARFGLEVETSPASAGSQDTRINSAYARDFALSFVEYGPEVTVKLDDAYRLIVSTNGAVRSISESASVLCDATCGFLSSPRSSVVTHSPPGTSRLNVSFPREALARHFFAMSGTAWRSPVEFQEEIEFTRGVGRAIQEIILQSANDIALCRTPSQQQRKIAQLRDWLFSTLLAFHPHNHSDELNRIDSTATPRDVKRAVDYIRAHADTVVGMAELVRASGVPGRTLHEHFVRFERMSPMAYLRKVRLENVRSDLLSAGPDAVIAEIAARRGFGHQGRMARYYKEAYGETPSATLTRNRTR
jgi:AraC-like DNA-binding protein